MWLIYYLLLSYCVVGRWMLQWMIVEGDEMEQQQIDQYREPCGCPFPGVEGAMHISAAGGGWHTPTARSWLILHNGVWFSNVVIIWLVLNSHNCESSAVCTACACFRSACFFTHNKKKYLLFSSMALFYWTFPRPSLLPSLVSAFRVVVSWRDPFSTSADLEESSKLKSNSIMSIVLYT